MIKLFQKFARCGAELHGLKRRSRKKAGRTAARARRAIGCPPVRVRDRTGQAGPWPHRTSRSVAGRDKPPSCLRQGRVRGRTGRAAFLPTARAGAWPHRTSRLLACGKGGCVAAQDKPPSCLRQGRVRGRTGRAAFLPAARAGAWPHRTSRPLACRKGGCVAAQDEPPSCVPQGRGLRPVSWVGTRERAWKPTLFARLTAGGSCLFLGLVAAPFSSADSVKRWCPPGISAPASSLHKACAKTLCLSSL